MSIDVWALSRYLLYRLSFADETAFSLPWSPGPAGILTMPRFHVQQLTLPFA